MGTIEARLKDIANNPNHSFYCAPTPKGSSLLNPTELPGSTDPEASLAPHRLEELLVLSARPRRVRYREACPPYDEVDAILFAERPDGRAMLVYLRGQNVVVDAAAQRGMGQFGGWWGEGED